MAFKIGDINIENQVVMAPMAGISNPSYMKIIEEMSAGLAFTELLSTEAIVRDNKKTFDMLNGIETLKMPIGVQIFGSNPETMAKAAKKLCQLYPIKIIDINMGCPVPKVAVKSNSGSALLKNPQLVYDIVSQVKKNVDAEVTVKIRSGWDSKNINAVEIAKICEQAGASAITVHGRTRSQGYSGDVDLDIIKKSGSWYSYGEDRIGQGRENAKQYLKDNPEILAEVDRQVRLNFGIGADGKLTPEELEAMQNENNEEAGQSHLDLAEDE